MVYRMEESVVYRVWIPDQGETEEGAVEIRAYSGYDAVTSRIQYLEARYAEYTVAAGGTEEVHVRTPDGRHEVWSVTGEIVPHYVATRKA